MALDGPLPPLLVFAFGTALIAWRAARRSLAASALTDVIAISLIVAVALGLEWRMGRTPTYRHGPIRLWSGDVTSDQNSQQIADPYTFTHVVHGAAFYGLARLLPVSRAWAFGPTAIAITTVEASWEAYENTQQVIDRYRSETISLGYYGDSLLNSGCDVLACLMGLAFAWRRPARLTWAWVVATELVLALWIRDNLTLNLLMLISPIPAVKTWQAGGPL
jgi:hypothetical protein